MFDLGWSELLIIGVAALIVVGPKDLPRMLRTLGRYAARAKGVAREFQRAMDDAARQADIEELKEVRKDLDAMRSDTYRMQREMTQTLVDSKVGTAKPAAGSASGASSGASPAPGPAAKPAAAPDADPGPTPGEARGS